MRKSRSRFAEFRGQAQLTGRHIKELAGLQVKLYEKQAAAHASRSGDEMGR